MVPLGGDGKKEYGESHGISGIGSAHSTLSCILCIVDRRSNGRILRDEGRGNPSQLLSRWGLLIQFLADFLARKNVAQVVCYLRAIRQAR